MAPTKSAGLAACTAPSPPAVSPLRPRSCRPVAPPSPASAAAPASSRLDRRRQHHGRPERRYAHGELGGLRRPHARGRRAGDAALRAATATASLCRPTSSAPPLSASTTSSASRATITASATTRTPAPSSTSTPCSSPGSRAPCATRAADQRPQALAIAAASSSAASKTQSAPPQQYRAERARQEDRGRGAVHPDPVHLRRARLRGAGCSRCATSGSISAATSSPASGPSARPARWSSCRQLPGVYIPETTDRPRSASPTTLETEAMAVCAETIQQLHDDPRRARRAYHCLRLGRLHPRSADPRRHRQRGSPSMTTPRSSTIITIAQRARLFRSRARGPV